ncbi:hypothetical protein KFU94_32965 [Chloroflexi bacterium TSY]|nr:hypothetical protein [Chloroflexi bacterium TSY]
MRMRLSRSKFGVFGYFQSRLQGFWSHLFRFRLQKTTYFISENRPNLTQKLDIDRQICIYVNCLARILSQNLKFGSTESTFGVRPDPIKIFADAVNDAPSGFERFKRIHTYTEEDGGDFERWEVKGKFGSSVWTHYRGMGETGDRMLLEMMLNRHRSQGLDYVEYRCGSGMGGFLYWHRICAEVLQEANDAHFTARYILSIPRYAPMDAYGLTIQLLDTHPELIPTIGATSYYIGE